MLTKILRSGFFLALAALCPIAPSRAGTSEIRVVTTIPDLADIVQAIGGKHVSVTSIARGKENTHNVPVRPSHLVAMSKADLFVQVGLALESSFVPGLLENCRNKAIQPGQPGFLNVSEGWEAIDVPASLSRAEGDVHPYGNPHMNLDPRAGRHIAQRVRDCLVALDPASQAEYESAYAAYAALLEPAEKHWAEIGQALAGKKLVVYHKEYDYLARLYGLEIVGTIEPKPGIAPTPASVAELVAKMKATKAEVILTAQWSNNSTTMRLAEATGARIVELPNLCGGMPGTESWIGMMNTIHARLLEAFQPNGEQAGGR